MGIGLAFLIAVMTLLVEPQIASAAQVRCLACHPVHYTDQGGCISCHRGNGYSRRKPLAHNGLIRARYAVFGNRQAQAVIRGAQLADRAACRRCHRMSGSGNRLASSLDGLLQNRTPEEIQAAIAKPAVFMPDFHFSVPDRESLVTAILHAGSRGGKLEAETPQVVYFSDQPQQRKNVFVKQCGGCHRILTAREGGLGAGNNGPNLSGLLTAYYPKNFQNQHPWTVDRLKRWLKNPREVRDGAQMRPLSMPVDEWQSLLDILRPAVQVFQPEKAPLNTSR